jgi:hypothetical protein
MMGRMGLGDACWTMNVDGKVGRDMWMEEKRSPAGNLLESKDL